MQYKNLDGFQRFLNFSRDYWNNIAPYDLVTRAHEVYPHIGYSNLHSNSRTLTDSLRSVIQRQEGYNGLNIALAMCNLVANYTGIKISSDYCMLDSVKGTDLTREKLSQYLSIPEPVDNDFNIYFWHMPKGKSYLKKALDNDTFLNRATTLEPHVVATPDQFIRIYYNWNTQAYNNCVYIISDTFNTATVLNIMLLMPHLMRIKLDNPNIKEEEKTIYTQRVTKLFEFFETLCRIAETDPDFPWETETLLAKSTTPTLEKIINEFVELFDLISESFNEFTKKLANIKNEKSKHYWQQRINNTQNDIEQYERTLIDKYKTLAQAQHELVANQKLNPEDLTEFIDTIKQSKSIQILGVSPYQLKLKITAPLQYFQSEDFEAHERNKNSDYNKMFKEKPIWQSILHKVFITKEYQILLQGIITLTINDNSWESNIIDFHGRTDGQINYNQYPNPHLYYFDCWSKAKTEIAKNINAGNFDLVIYQMIAAVQSVNVAEQQSFVNKMLGDIANNNDISKKLTFIINTPEGKKELKYSAMLKHEAELLLQSTTTEQPTETQNTQPAHEYTQIEIPDDGNWGDNTDEHIPVNPLPDLTQMTNEQLVDAIVAATHETIGGNNENN